MVDDTTTASGDEATTGTTMKRRPWDGRFGRADRGDDTGGAGGPRRDHTADINKVRTLVARIVWAVAAVFALILAAAVLLIAVDANAKNDLVRWIIARAADVDLGFFSLTNPIKDWDTDKGPADDVKSALFNYGIAAIVWLAIGKIADKVIRP